MCTALDTRKFSGVVKETTVLYCVKEKLERSCQMPCHMLLEVLLLRACFGDTFHHLLDISYGIRVWSETMQNNMHSSYGVQIRPYRLVPGPAPSYGVSVVPSPHVGNVLYSSYGVNAAPPYSSPHHRYPQFPVYVPPMHYSVLAPPLPMPVMVPVGSRQSGIPGLQHGANIPPWQSRAYMPPVQRRGALRMPVMVPVDSRQSGIPGLQHGANIPPWQSHAYMPPVQRRGALRMPVMVPVGSRQSGIPGLQHGANIPPWQSRAYMPPVQRRAYMPPGQHLAYMPSGQRRAYIPPGQRRANIPPNWQHQVYMSVLQVDQSDHPTPLSYADGVQLQTSDEAEVMIVYPPPQVPEIDDVTHAGGTPAAQHTLESLTSVVLPLDDDLAECVICMDEMCTQDEKGITKLPCDHFFHKNCIVLWLSSNNTCPLCRFELPVDETTLEA